MSDVKSKFISNMVNIFKTFLPPKREVRVIHKEPSLLAISPFGKILPKQQFGVTLKYLRKIFEDDIPPIVRTSIEYLDNQKYLRLENLFRVSTSFDHVKELKEVVNNGYNLEFQSPYEAATILRTFLRELKEPVIPSDLYKSVVAFNKYSKEQQLRQIFIIIREKMRVENYNLLKYIFKFLSKVMEHNEFNKMSVENLAEFFGTNLCWPPNRTMTLEGIAAINEFTKFLLEHSKDIFSS